MIGDVHVTHGARHRRVKLPAAAETRCERWHRLLLAAPASVLALWSRVQISHRGKYSIERLQALDEYCKTVTLWRVVSVCVLTPVPALALVLALECIPLRDPSLGCRANYRAWLRTLAVSYSVGQGLLVQVTGMIPSIPMPRTRGILVALCTSVCCTALLITLSMLWVYPAPFAIVLGVLPFVVLFPVFFVVAVGRRPFLLIPNLVLQLQRQLVVLLAQATLVIVYPSFNAVFMSLSLSGQLFAVAMLPAVKIAVKLIVAWSCTHLEDYVPEIVAFSVDVFNSLYISACMQSSSGRVLTTALVMGFDLLQMALAVRDILQRTGAVQRWNPSGVWSRPQSLLATILEICERPELLSASAFQKIRLRSPIKLKLSEHSRNVLVSLVRRRAKIRDGDNPTGINRRRRTSVIFSGLQNRFKSQVQPWISGPTKRQLKITPVPTAVPTPAMHPVALQALASENGVTTTQHAETRPLEQSLAIADAHASASPTTGVRVSTVVRLPPSEKTLLMHETLKVLFQCEYLVLVEYIECAAPLLYAIYSTAIYYLPNAVYFPQTAHLTPDDVTSTTLYLFGYALLELLSLLAFNAVVQRRFGFSPLYLLAFVLEHQAQQVQGRLFVWVVYILPFPLQHYGVDFSFEFKWLRGAHSSNSTVA